MLRKWDSLRTYKLTCDFSSSCCRSPACDAHDMGSEIKADKMKTIPVQPLASLQQCDEITQILSNLWNQASSLVVTALCNSRPVYHNHDTLSIGLSKYCKKKKRYKIKIEVTLAIITTNTPGN